MISLLNPLVEAPKNLNRMHTHSDLLASSSPVRSYKGCYLFGQNTVNAGEGNGIQSIGGRVESEQDFIHSIRVLRTQRS